MLGIYSTARVYVNCADEFQTREGSQTRIYDFFARTVDHDSRVFVIQCYKFLLYLIVV